MTWFKLLLLLLFNIIIIIVTVIIIILFRVIDFGKGNAEKVIQTFDLDKGKNKIIKQQNIINFVQFIIKSNVLLLYCCNIVVACLLLYSCRC